MSQTVIMLLIPVLTMIFYLHLFGIGIFQTVMVKYYLSSYSTKFNLDVKIVKDKKRGHEQQFQQRHEHKHECNQELNLELTH